MGHALLFKSVLISESSAQTLQNELEFYVSKNYAMFSKTIVGK